jgi:aryl-alcohol dehydrogenase-like predicted oxidoreductase
MKAFAYLITQGKIMYWGTSDWSAAEISAACGICQLKGYPLPCVEQCQFNMLSREKVQKEYLPLFQLFGIGTMTYSALAHGILTGKYNKGVPPDSRFGRANGPNNFSWHDFLLANENKVVSQLTALQGIADSLSCSLAQLAMAWQLTVSNVSSIIMGVSSCDQLMHNLGALAFVSKLDTAMLMKIETILGNKPAPQREFKVV